MTQAPLCEHKAEQQGCGARELVTALPSCFFPAQLCFFSHMGQFGKLPGAAPSTEENSDPQLSVFLRKRQFVFLAGGGKWVVLTDQGFHAPENLSQLAHPRGRHMGAKGIKKKAE